MRDLIKKPQNHLQLASDQHEDFLEDFGEQPAGSMEEEELFADHFQLAREFETHDYQSFSLRSSPLRCEDSPKLRFLHDLDEGKASFELFPSHDRYPQDSLHMMEEPLPLTSNPKPHTEHPGLLLNTHQTGTDVRLEMFDSCSLSLLDDFLREPSIALSTQEVSSHHSEAPKKSIRIYVEIPDEIFSQYRTANEQDRCPKKPGASEEKNYCSCSRSRCLKLYCQCFRKGVVCGLDCRCKDCENTAQNQDKIRELREPKVSRLLEEDFCCNCKMSFCEKSYCVCARSGQGCSAKCRCFNCKNPNGRQRRF